MGPWKRLGQYENNKWAIQGILDLAGAAKREECEDRRGRVQGRHACQMGEACVMRWKEEYLLVQEEMCHVIAWFKWKAEWWEAQEPLQKDGNIKVLMGVRAYAHKQASILCKMARRCAQEWLPMLCKLGIEPEWGSCYLMANEGEERDDLDDNEEEEIVDVDVVQVEEAEPEAEDGFEYDD